MQDKLIPFMEPQRVITRTMNNTEYKIRLARPITDIDDFADEIMALESATPDDLVVVQISSPGGSLETCDFICRRMNECAAPIIVEIGLTCASAASALMLQADEWIINDSSTAMVHACSWSPGWGKEADLRASVLYTERLNREWVERTYKGFVTDEELTQILDGKDLYFFADDLRERLPKYKEYRESLRASQPCQCGQADCENNQSLLELEDEEDFPEFSLEDLIAAAVEKGITEHEKKKLQKEAKAAKKSTPKLVEKAE